MGNGGGIGGFMTDVMGGENDYQQNTHDFKRNDYTYGGRSAYDYETQGGQQQGRAGAQIDYGNAGASRLMGLGSRGSEADATEMARQAAMGQVPSVAQNQLLMGRDQSIQNAMAMANSVRGGGANLAAAQMGAMRQGGETMGQVNQQSAMLRANEMAQARGQYGALAAQQRAHDLQLQGLDANQAQAQAQLEQQQKAQNDQYSMGLYGLGQHAADSSLAASMGLNRDQAGNEISAGQINADIAKGNAGQAAAGGQQAAGTAAAAMGAMAMMSDERVKTHMGSGSAATSDFLGSLAPTSYRYKEGVPGESPNADRFGILAQDVGRTPMGRSLIEETPIGKAINVPHATGALLAGEGELYARQRRLEAEIHALRGGR